MQDSYAKREIKIIFFCTSVKRKYAVLQLKHEYCKVVANACNSSWPAVPGVSFTGRETQGESNSQCQGVNYAFLRLSGFECLYDTSFFSLAYSSPNHFSFLHQIVSFQPGIIYIFLLVFMSNVCKIESNNTLKTLYPLFSHFFQDR